MSKDLFYLMREEEVVTSNFLPTKKEVNVTSKNFATSLVESGNYNIQELFSQVVRFEEAVTTIKDVLKQKLPDENFEAYGIKGTYRSGGDTINYAEDEVYTALKADLDARAELIKLAQKQDVFDAYGNQVTKVSTTPRKSSLAISF
jgi:hypothetical protein